MSEPKFPLSVLAGISGPEPNSDVKSAPISDVNLQLNSPSDRLIARSDDTTTGEASPDDSGFGRSSRGKWTAEEDEILRNAVQKHGGRNWKKISDCLEGRTDVQCLHRWQKVLRPGLIKGPWTKEVQRDRTQYLLTRNLY
jgi:hypothetical protein